LGSISQGAERMSDFIKSLGRMLIFSIVLPGIIGCITISALFLNLPTNIDSSGIGLSLYIFFVGFIANAFGYLIDIIIQCIANCLNCFFSFLKSPYEEFIVKYSSKDIKQRLIDDYDLLFCESACYLNTAIILFLIALVRNIDGLNSAFIAFLKASNAQSVCTTQLNTVSAFLIILSIIVRERKQ
jgi:hypothetical protein